MRMQECFYNPVTIECQPVDAVSSITVISSVKADYNINNTTVLQRLLVMIVEYPECGFPAGLDETTVRNLFLGPGRDGQGGLALKYTQCSYGKFGLNVTAFRVVRVPHMCSTPISSSCAFWAISSLADVATKSLIGENAFSSFTHFTYIVPPGIRSVCRWAGLALLPGERTWLQTIPNGVYRWSTAMQEGLHNYGA